MMMFSVYTVVKYCSGSVWLLCSKLQVLISVGASSLTTNLGCHDHNGSLEKLNRDNEAEKSVGSKGEAGKEHSLEVPLPTNMGSLRVEKDKVVVGDISSGATLDDMVAAIKNLGQKIENMDNHNKRRLDAMEKTNTTMLKAMCNLVKQDYNQSAKDVVEDVAMSGTHNTPTYDEALCCGNPNEAVSKATIKCSRKEAYGKCREDLKNIETIFIPGDDDDDFLMSKHTAVKEKFLGQEKNSSYSSPKIANLSGPNEVKTIDDSSPQQPFMSNYIRGVKTKIFQRPQTNSSRGYTHTIPKVLQIIAFGHVMLTVLQTVFETQDLLFGFDGMDSWDIVEARRIPNCGSKNGQTIGALVFAAFMLFAGWFHYHKAAPKLAWSQHVNPNSITILSGSWGWDLFLGQHIMPYLILARKTRHQS
ncbi:hypothetical protein JHK86_048098 [Glycine max]|nr:hypothetical protein JHK86_048098 [Glycine max]